MNDLENRILAELKHGSKEAFEYIFRTYYTSLCKYAKEILKDPQQAEDVVINLFATVWDDRKLLNIHTSIGSYLYRSTYNACLNVLRKKKIENKYRDYFIHHADFSRTHDYGSLSYPLSGIIENEMEIKVNKVIDDLPPQCKKIFLMSRVDDYSHKEIAEKLDLSVNTVKSQIMNALKKINANLKKILTFLPLFF